MSFREITLRPLAVFTFSFYALSCLFCRAHTAVRVATGIACLLFFVICLIMDFSHRRDKSTKGLRRRHTWGAVAALAAGAALAATVSYFTFDAYLGEVNRYDGQTVSVKGRVTDTVYSESYGSKFVLKTRSLCGGRSIKLEVLAPSPVSVGDGIECTLALSAPDADGLDSMSDGILLTGEASDMKPWKNADFDIEIASAKLNMRLSSVLTEKLGKRYGALASALLLGNRRNLASDMYRDFRRLGISHLLALSGLHLTVLCGTVGIPSRRFGKKAHLAISAAVVVFYMLITGLSPSVTRAGIMMLMLTAASFARRRGDSFTNLGIAAFLIVSVNPFSSLDVGLQLSVLAVFALLLMSNGGILKDWNASSAPSRILLRAAASIGVAFAVLLMTLPLMWYYFGSLAVMSPIATLIFSPIVSIILVAALVTLILSPSPILSYLPAALCSAVCGIAEKLALRLSLLSDIVLPLSGVLCAVLCIIACILFAVFALSRKKLRLISGILCAAVFTALCVTSYVGAGAAPGQTVLSFETSSSGDALTVVSRKKAYVIDIGNGRTLSLYSALSKAQNSVFGETETLVLTHYHSAYASSLATLLNRFRVRELAVPSTLEDGDIQLLKEAAKTCQTRLVLYTYGECLSFGETSVTVAEPLYIKRSVQPAVRIDIKSGGGDSFVYLGSGYNDACEIPYIPQGAFVCLGSHGPEYKRSWDNSSMSGAATVAALGSAADFAPERAEKLTGTVLAYNGT